MIHVVGERQSARLREKRVKTSPSSMTDVTDPEVTAHVPTNTVDDTFNTVIDGPDPTFYHVIGEGKEIHSTTEGNSDRLVQRFFDELVDSRSEETRKDPVIMLVEPRSLRLSQDERETETIPGRLSEEIVEPSSVVSTVEGSSEQLTLSGPPDPPRVSSKSEVNSQVILSCEKSCDVPGQCGPNRIKPDLRSKVRGILNINWDEKISKWFRIVHVHNVGHTGLERTTSKLFEIPEVQRYSLQGYLPKDLKSRIGEMIKSCNTCQKNTSMKPTAQASHFSCSVYKKMKIIAIDYIEALRPDAEGNDMIVVIIDCFSRFITLYPVKSKGTEVFLYAYLNWIGMGFGDPEEILVDRGSQFTSKLTAELAKEVGHTMIYTTANSKEENAIVERANREVMRHLRNIIMDKRAIDEWAKNVPLVQRILNSMVHSSTGVRPSSIIYSEELDPSIIRSSRSTPMEDEVDKTGETTKEESSDIIEWEEKCHY